VAGMIERLAVLRGSAVAIAICLPAALAAQAVVDTPEGDDPPATVFLFFLLVLLGFALGGWWAARSAPTAPYTNGAVAALAAFVVIQGVAVVVRVVGGDGVNVPALVFNGLVAYLSGLAGAFVWSRSHA
jgi:hypothetical protein